MENLTIVLTYFNNDTLFTATVDTAKHSIEATKKAVAKRVWEALVKSTGATPENYNDFDKMQKDFIKTRAKQVQENLPETVERWLEIKRKTLSFKGTVEIEPVAKRSKKTYSINIYRYNRELNSSEFFAYEMEKYTTKVEALKSLPLFVRKDETTGSYYVTEATTGLKVADARKKKDLELDLQRLADRYTLDELMQKLQESIEKNGCANPEYSGVAPEKEEAPMVEVEKEEKTEATSQTSNECKKPAIEKTVAKASTDATDKPKDKGYKYYQPNKKDLKDNYGDCVIRTICKATGMEWLEVFDTLCGIARELQCMPNSKASYTKFLELNGFTYVGVSNKKGTKRPTVSSFTKNNKHGTYVLVVANHLVCSKDGAYYDTWDSGDCSMYGYWIKADD